LIAFSRVYLYVHFPTDVVAGAILGIACGYGAKLLVKKLGRQI
ncbi:MAG: phosphatase PAP2 family protein, partial [Clostridia bacterium]